MVREAQLLLDATGAAKHHGGGTRRKVPRATLISLGPWAEFCCDGHEKLSSKALLMGPVGIPIYEIRDKASGRLIKLEVVPDARLSDTIGHLYLDMVEEWGCIPLQITTDKDSETGVVEIHAKAVSLVKFPAFVAVQSVHNIIAESLWHWMRKTLTGDIEHIIKRGQTDGIFISIDGIHIQLFQWLWPKIVQNHLNEFTVAWNTGKPRTQQSEALPSGAVRNDVFINPTAYNLERVSVPVPREIVDHCRSEIETSREESFRWVSPEFAEVADWAYEIVGRPTLSANFGWMTYQKMLPHIQTYMYENGLQ
ncbi:hypothetical protein BDZ89DRAFT_965903 [Hymenopellis radicata]|nr:hypothetical protein BDZ89DRAFT_965903 [Hymenopellis radicata]